MEKIMTISAMITVLYFVAKIMEMKFIDKELKPLKFLIRDSVIVFCSSMVSLFAFLSMNGSVNDFMNVVTNNKSLNLASTEVFTDEPGF